MKYYSKTRFRGCPGLPQIVGFEERRWNGKETSSKIRKAFPRPGEANLTYFKTQNPRNVLIVRRRHMHQGEKSITCIMTSWISK